MNDNNVAIASLDAQIKSVKRELALRQRNYPKWVAAGRMTAATAALELASMQGVLDTLHAVRDFQHGAAGADPSFIVKAMLIETRPGPKLKSVPGGNAVREVDDTGPVVEPEPAKPDAPVVRTVSRPADPPGRDWESMGPEK